MIRHLLHVDFDPRRGLQEQVRETLINAILGGIFPPTRRSLLPPAGQPAAGLAQHHGAGFEGLVNEGYLLSRPRSGYYLHPDYQHANPPPRQKLHPRMSVLHHAGARGCKSRPASRSRF